MRRVLGLLSLSATLAAIAAAPAGASTVYHGVLGTAAKITRSRSTAAPAATSFPRGARQIPRGTPAWALHVRAPRAAGSRLRAVSAPLLANFNGVSSLDSAVTNFGLEFEPPDQGLCTGNGFVLEMVNSAYTIYRPNGSKVQGPFNVNGPFDEGLKEFTSDPRCRYDQATQKWYATILFLNSSFTAGRIDIAVSQTSDPTGLWNNYEIDTTTGFNGAGCPCFGDQPKLGIDQDNLYVGTEEFSILGSGFFGDQLYAISKADLAAGNATAHFAHFGNLSIGGTNVAIIQPALTTGTPQAEYFLNSLDPNGTFDDRIGVWAMTNRSNIAHGVVPTLSSVIVSSEPYAIPPPAQQMGTDPRLDSGDDRMQQTQFIKGRIYGELDTSLTLPNNPESRAGAAWFEVVPTLSGNVLSSARMLHQGYVALGGNYVIYPALQVTPNGTAVMGATLTGANRFPSTAYATKTASQSQFGPITLAAAGRTNYDPNAGRWGDYSWAIMDPTGTSVWLANEYVPAVSSQTTDGSRNWGTRVLDVPTGTP